VRSTYPAAFKAANPSLPATFVMVADETLF
jgi:hypothetical protein